MSLWDSPPLKPPVWSDADVVRAMTDWLGVPPYPIPEALVRAMRRMLVGQGVSPGDPQALVFLRRLQHGLHRHVLAPALVERHRQKAGLTAADVLARGTVSRCPQAPTDVRQCTLPWQRLEFGLHQEFMVAREFIRNHPKTGSKDFGLTDALLGDFVENWKEAKQVFRVSPAFVDMLGRTTTPIADPADFALPYDCFWIAIPGCTRQVLDPIAGGSLALAGLGVRIAQPGVILPSGGVIEGPTVHLWAWGAPPGGFAVGPNGVVDDVYTPLTLPLGVFYAAAPEDAMRTLLAGGFEDSDDADDAVDLHAWCIRVVVNFILYLNSMEPEVRSAPENAEWAARRWAAAAKKNPSKRARMLRGIPDFTLTDLAPSIRDEPDGGTGEGQHLRRHWVRGHWRRQPVGPGRAQLRLLWVRPHLRGGADDDPVVPRVYTKMEIPSSKGTHDGPL